MVDHPGRPRLRADCLTMVTRRTTTQRGLGWHHQQQREALLARHRDGARCWWCGEPMYRDAVRNLDGESLAADHSHARAHGGTRADRLLHGLCNKSRGDGSRDDRRPALTRRCGGHAGNVLEWS
ncbi:hypothetical protein ACFXHA_45150 [Nocardia sp. NPDC059240]|uniref:hypothetical protein n=1 Tax=Nocardia sp. NPDC059240 TaxID=3346786 RepID=UPI00368B0938